MQQLNLPSFGFRTRDDGKNRKIFDDIRKKWVSLTPEEWVRQHLVRYMVEYKNYPPGLINIEKEFQLNKTKKRADIVVFNRSAQAVFILECKAPHIKISPNTFEQVLNYFIGIRARFIAVSNGITHFCIEVQQDGGYNTLESFPTYENIMQNT